MTTPKENLESLLLFLYELIEDEGVTLNSDTFEQLTISFSGSESILNKLLTLHPLFININNEDIFLQNEEGIGVELDEIRDNITTPYFNFNWKISINKIKWFRFKNYVITSFFNLLSYTNWLENIEILNQSNEFIKYQNIQIILPMNECLISGQNFLISNKIVEHHIFEQSDTLPNDKVIKEYVHVISNEKTVFNPNVYKVDLDLYNEFSQLLYKNYAEALATTIIQVYYTKDNVVLKGLKYLQLKLNDSYIPEIDTIKTLEKCIYWIYEENTATRIQLLVDRLSFYEGEQKNLISILDNHIEDAFIEAKDRYQFVVTEKSNEYTKDLKDLLKDTKEKVDKYSDKTRSIINSLMRDTLGSIFFLGLTAYSRFSTNKDFMLSDDANIIFILLGSYFLLSMFSQAIFNLWDISLSKKESEKWSKSSIEYMSQDSYDKYVTEPLKVRRWQLIKVQFVVVLVYLGLAYASFNVQVVSNYFIPISEKVNK